MKNTIEKIKQRIKSPVVIIQLVSMAGAVVVLLIPDKADYINQIAIAIAGVISAIAGINNPDNKGEL